MPRTPDRSSTIADTQAALDRAVEIGHEPQYHPHRLADGVSSPRKGLTSRGWYLVIIVSALGAGGACALFNWVFPR